MIIWKPQINYFFYYPKLKRWGHERSSNSILRKWFLSPQTKLNQNVSRKKSGLRSRKFWECDINLDMYWDKQITLVGILWWNFFVVWLTRTIASLHHPIHINYMMSQKVNFSFLYHTYHCTSERTLSMVLQQIFKLNELLIVTIWMTTWTYLPCPLLVNGLKRPVNFVLC